MVGQQNATVGLLQDLKNLFVYWDFSPERVSTLHDFITNVKPQMKICLRLKGLDRENNAFSTIEREVFFDHLETYGRYYFYGVNPDLNYLFELGGKEPNGSFLLFSRSKLMELHPSQTRSSVGVSLSPDLKWEALVANQYSSGSY